MAEIVVVAKPFNSTLQIILNMGVDMDGKQIKKTRSYTNVKPDATDEDVHSVAQSINGLQEPSRLAYYLIDKVELAEESQG